MSNDNNNENNYGRGSEIWPPTNQNRAIQLQDSFPNGKIPTAVWDQLGVVVPSPRTTPTTTTTTTTSKKKNNKLKRLWLERVPAILAVSLLGGFWIRPMDVGLVMTLSVYTGLLTLAASSARTSNNNYSEYYENEDNDEVDDAYDPRTTTTTTASASGAPVPTVPSLPPQGHIPQMVQNPMHDLSYSFVYDIWWRCGIGLGFILPLLTVAYYYIIAATTAAASSDITITASSAAAALVMVVTRPLFLLSCQAFSELVCKDWLVPLPIRIWIPISYQILRLVYLALGFFHLLLMTTTTTTTMPYLYSWIQALTGFNLLYTLVNVFAFLIPVALMRYMRAHFFAVEAASVTIHPGMEETLGLSSMPSIPPPPTSTTTRTPMHWL